MLLCNVAAPHPTRSRSIPDAWKDVDPNVLIIHYTPWKLQQLRNWNPDQFWASNRIHTELQPGSILKYYRGLRIRIKCIINICCYVMLRSRIQINLDPTWSRSIPNTLLDLGPNMLIIWYTTRKLQQLWSNEIGSGSILNSYNWIPKWLNFMIKTNFADPDPT